MSQANDPGGDAVHFDPFIPPSTEELDELIPSYKFLQFIERGGMGAVYKAVQKSLNRPVAVKLLPQVHRDKESFAERFRREAQALALLNHPHIVAVHDFGETAEGQMYYVMEYVDGMDLQHLLRRDPPEPKQMLKIITQVCEALQFAHEHGIVHRDIKPANILIDARGNVKVADFGLAKVVGPQSVNYTATGMMIGTPDYIAPEALEHGGEIDHRADIYSLGVMIYEIFTGHVPKGVWEPPSIRSGADKGIDAIVSKAMQNNPEKRYQHVGELTQVLEKLFKNSDNWKNFRRRPPSIGLPTGRKEAPVPTGAVTLKIRQSGGSGRRWLPWAAAMLLLLGVGFAAAWQAGLLAPEPEVNQNAAEVERPDVVIPQQMELARFVMKHGGVVNVQTPTSSEKAMGGLADLRAYEDLPSGAFTIWRVSFLEEPVTDLSVYEELVARIRAAGTVSNLNLHALAVPTDALKSLASMPTLTSLDLMSSPAVTSAAVPYITACKQLRLLRIGGLPTPESGVLEQLRALLPDCGVHDDK